MRDRLKSGSRQAARHLDSTWRSHLASLLHNSQFLNDATQHSPSSRSPDAGRVPAATLMWGPHMATAAGVGSRRKPSGSPAAGGMSLRAVEAVARAAGHAVERVQSTEARLNASSTVAALAQQYRAAAEQESELRADMGGLQEAVAALSNRYRDVADAAAEVQEQLHQRGASMSDSAPIQRMRTCVCVRTRCCVCLCRPRCASVNTELWIVAGGALAKIRQETKTMDVRLGALRYEVDRARMKAMRRKRQAQRAGAGVDMSTSTWDDYSDDDGL